MKGVDFVKYFDSRSKDSIIIEMNSGIEEMETPMDVGMICKVTGIEYVGDDVYCMYCSLKGFEEFNSNYEKANFYDGDGNPVLKWSETSFYPKNLIEKVYFSGDLNVFWDVRF